MNHMVQNKTQRHVMIDVETTGLAPHRGDRVIEVGALVLADYEIAEEFHTLVYVRKRIPVSAWLIHGISNEMLEGAPESDEVFSKLKKFIGKSTIVAHNAQFDMGFLKYEFSRVGLEMNNRYKCTLQLSRQRYPRLPNHRLETVYRYVTGRRPDGQSHRALGDARMVAEIWKAVRDNGAPA